LGARLIPFVHRHRHVLHDHLVAKDSGQSWSKNTTNRVGQTCRSPPSLAIVAVKFCSLGEAVLCSTIAKHRVVANCEVRVNANTVS
jgi:hypothetical protein